MDKEIIDCHIHPAVDKQTDFCWYKKSGSIRKQFDDLRRVGISRACGSPVIKRPPYSFKEIKKLNDIALSIRDKFPDFYIPGIQIHPNFPDESCNEIERCCRNYGVRWIGELVGYLMGFSSNDYISKNMIEILKYASKYRVVVNFHCSDINVIEKLCKNISNINFVLAHPGEGKEFMNRINLVKKIKNLFLDISGTGIYRYGMLKKAVEIGGYQKIIFGTDYPVNNPAVYVYGVLFEQLSENETKAIFSGNFIKLVL